MNEDKEVCPACLSWKIVVCDSRAGPMKLPFTRQDEIIRRRRIKCLDCTHRWNTIEVRATYFDTLEEKQPDVHLLKHTKEMIEKMLEGLA